MSLNKSLKISALNLSYSFGAILLTGSVISGILNPDKRWMEWHFSRLGEGGMFSSYIFNITLVIAAFLIYNLGKAICDDICRIKTLPSDKTQRGMKIIRSSFYIVTICLLVVAAFPFDQFQVIHNIFGYSMLFVFIYLCTSISKILPVFSQNFYIYGFSIIGATIVCYILFLGYQILTLLEVEAILFTMLYLWLVLFIKNIHKLSQPIPVLATK